MRDHLTYWIGALNKVFVLFKDQLHFAIAQSAILCENNNIESLYRKNVRTRYLNELLYTRG